MGCIFCDIASGQIPAALLFDDKDIIAFRDRNPQAPTHILIIPKCHISTINDIEEDNQLLMGKMVAIAKKLAISEGLSAEGYRLIFNVNANGGQTVYHIHLHLLGGRKMSWPPG